MILKAGGRLTFFVKHVGLNPLQVITCATRTGAEIMGREKEFGTLEVVKLADVLVVDQDVLADISVLEDRQHFIAVLQGGIMKAGQLAFRP
jgi:imidazolonepropionase-like amidohydrolase